MKHIEGRWFICGQLIIWIGFALLTRYTWIDVRPPSWSWIASYMGLGLLFSTMLVPAFRLLAAKTFIVQVIGLIFMSVILGLAWRICFNTIEYHILESANNQFKFWGYFHNGKSAVMQLMVWSTGYWMFHYYRMHLLQSQRTIKAESEAKSATLKLLHYQINPHFLFNVFSGIDTLLLKKNTGDARSMLAKLTDFMRTSLEKEPSASISLSDELSRIKSYLEIEKIRFGERLVVHWSLPRTIPSISIPTAILLPVVENAMKYGVSSSAQGGNVKIAVEQRAQGVLFRIANKKVNCEHSVGFGMGLENTRQRLSNSYDDENCLHIEESETDYMVSITLPCDYDV